jgi:glycosyltransferase involved in cell wall biosynthesis
MPRTPKIAVVIPCYRVAAHIRDVIRNMPTYIWKIIIVDDCSPDNTAQVISAMADSRIVLVRHEVNQGVGGAMVTGYRTALDLGAEIVVKMDGDDQMDPACLPDLIGPLLERKADYAKGNRWGHSECLASMPPARRWGNLGLSFLAKFASGYWTIFDPCNGYTAIRAEVLRQLPLERVARSYFFEISMLVQLNILGAVVRDVRMPARYGTEVSSLRVSRILLQFPSRLLLAMGSRIWRRYFINDFSPVTLFMLMGLSLSGFGLVDGIYGWVRSSATGLTATAGQVMIATMPILLGFQLLLQALNLDMTSEPKKALCRRQRKVLPFLLQTGSERREAA